MRVTEHTRHCIQVWGCAGLIACGGGAAKTDAGSNPGRDGALDGGRDATSEASDATTDASDATTDATTDAGMPSYQCPRVGEVIELPAAHRSRPVLAVDRAGDTLHVLYGAVPCRTGSRSGQGLRALRVSSAGEVPEAVDVVNTSPQAECVESLSPSLIARGPDESLLYYATSNDRRFELYGQELGDSLVLPPPGRRLTFDAIAAREREYTSAAATLGGGPLLVWAAERGVDGARSLWSMQPRGAAQPVELLAWDAESSPSALALSPLGKQGEGVLVWADVGSDPRRVVVQPLTRNGLAAQPAQSLAAALGTGVSLDVAAREKGAAVVYTAGADASELRLLLLDGEGAIRAEPIALTHANQRALDASIAAFSTGYVIAFRSIDGNGTGSPAIRLLFVDAEGLVAGYRNVAAATESGGQVQVEVASDGRILLAWPDVVPAGPVVRIVRVECS